VPAPLGEDLAQLPGTALRTISHAKGTAAPFIGRGQRMLTSLALPPRAHVRSPILTHRENNRP
jgi:hypothetical protein